MKSVLPRIVKVGYQVLNLRYYFTAGDTEVRCWTICAGAMAPEAAGVIHSGKAYMHYMYSKINLHLLSCIYT